jgi:hypothetical protein
VYPKYSMHCFNSFGSEFLNQIIFISVYINTIIKELKCNKSTAYNYLKTFGIL